MRTGVHRLRFNRIMLGHYMTTRTKLNITIYAASIMMMLNVFSKPLHISEAFQWVLIVGVFIPLGLTFYFIKKQKQERQEKPITADAAAQPLTDRQQRAKRALILMMVLGSIAGLCSPFWLPLTGTSLGTRGDLICGIIAALFVCAICGFRLRKL
jgi:FtsH-binding integral membrane protein